jgi:hypothetical protein
MKVRATQDGHYAGYYRYGPIDSDAGYTPGEVFEIRDGKHPVPMTDELGGTLFDKDGKPVFRTEKYMEKDKNGNMVEKERLVLFSDFSPEWMEQVPEDTPITYDYPPFELPIPYRKNVKKNATVTIGNFPIPAGAPGNMQAPKIFG